MSLKLLKHVLHVNVVTDSKGEHIPITERLTVEQIQQVDIQAGYKIEKLEVLNEYRTYYEVLSLAEDECFAVYKNETNDEISLDVAIWTRVTQEEMYAEVYTTEEGKAGVKEMLISTLRERTEQKIAKFTRMLAELNQLEKED